MNKSLISLGLALFVFQIALPARGSVEEIAEKFRNASSEEKRLAICIEAISQQAIHKGMPVSEMDEIFGTKYRIDSADGKSVLKTGVVDFGDQPNHWYLLFYINHNSSILGYELTNLNRKQGFGLEPLPADFKEIAQGYRRAKSDEQRFKICLDAMDKKAIHVGMAVSELTGIFGVGESERLGNGEVLCTTFLSNKPGTWRLCFCFSPDNDLQSTPESVVTKYYLTNMYLQPIPSELITEEKHASETDQIVLPNCDFPPPPPPRIGPKSSSK